MSTPGRNLIPCDIRFLGCQDYAVSAWLCPVEQTEVAACRPCRESWNALAALEPELKLRCPSCAQGRIKKAQSKPVDAGPITGIIADALTEAMRIEGVLINTRQAVLRRLARDAPWLDAWGGSAEEGAPADGSQAGADGAASAGRAGGEVGVPGPAAMAVR